MDEHAQEHDAGRQADRLGAMLERLRVGTPAESDTEDWMALQADLAGIEQRLAAAEHRAGRTIVVELVGGPLHSHRHHVARSQQERLTASARLEVLDPDDHHVIAVYLPDAHSADSIPIRWVWQGEPRGRPRVTWCSPLGRP